MNSARIAAQVGVISMVCSMVLYTVVSLMPAGASTPVAELHPLTPTTVVEEEAVLHLEEPAEVSPPEPVAHELAYTVRKGDTIGGVLESKGIESVHLLIKAAKPHVDLSKVRPGQVLVFDYFGDELRGFKYAIDEDSTLIVDASDVESVRVERAQYDSQLVRVNFKITSSLWNAAERLGFKPAQILEIAKVFENEIDLNTDLRPGASFSLVVNALLKEGNFVRFGSIRAISLTNAGKTHEAFYFNADKAIEKGWYSRKGVSLERVIVDAPRSASQRAFSAPFKKGKYKKYQKNRRRRPLKDGELQIGSDFYQKRCKGRCRHSALDIRASQGTPLVAMGSGVVRAKTSARSLCGFGVQIEMKDTSGQRWRTLYCHMSRISVKKGQRVKKGQIIGRSGGTPGTYGAGNTTAPHLHLELRKRTRKGRWALVDPLHHVDWRPFKTSVRYTKGYEPKKAKRVPRPPAALKGTSLERFLAQAKSAEQVTKGLPG